MEEEQNINMFKPMEDLGLKLILSESDQVLELFYMMKAETLDIHAIKANIRKYRAASQVEAALLYQRSLQVCIALSGNAITEEVTKTHRK